jgi:hypothetical protein
MARSAGPDLRDPRDLIVRAAIGLAGGLAVWVLTYWAPSEEGLKLVRGALRMAAMTLPVVLLGAYRALRPPVLAVWILATTGFVLFLGLADAAALIARSEDQSSPSAALVLGGPVLAIGHVLVRALDGRGKSGPAWPLFFNTGWTDGCRFLLSAALVGALIGVCGLASGLFGTIGMKQVGEFLFRSGILWPAAGLTFGLGVHFTADRADLAAAVRALTLGLLAWILPLLSLLIAGFLATLPFTGLEPLWDTGSAAQLMMAACIGLIVLANAAVQDETRAERIPRVLRYATRLASVLMAPLVVIAIVGVFLRIGQYGLSPERVMALLLLAPLAVFAGGHALAALSRRSWIAGFGKANLVGVIAILAALLSFLTGVVSPNRIAVQDQVRRLTSGQVAPDRFDYDLLRFSTGQDGVRALRKLSAYPGDAPRDAAIRRGAGESLASRFPRGVRSKAPVLVTTVGAAPIPPDFFSSLATVACDAGSPCAAMSLDITDDGKAEVLIYRGPYMDVWTRDPAGWRQLGHFSCPVDRKAFLAGDIRVVPRRDNVQDVEVAGVRRMLEPPLGCPEVEADVSPPPPLPPGRR